MVHRVLIVDDEKDVRRALQVLLEDEIADVEVRTAADGPEALGILEEHAFDLILTDFRMPEMDGLEFLARARKRHGNTPALLLTAYPDPLLAEQAITRAGVGLLVAKPMDLDYFVKVVTAFLVDPLAADRMPRMFEP